MSDDLTLEKLEISKRLSALEKEVTQVCERIDAHVKAEDEMFKAMKTVIERHDKILFGSNGSWEGVAVRLDRLLQKEKQRDWVLKSCVLAIVGLLIETFWILTTKLQ